MLGRLFWLCAGSIGYTYAGYPLLLTLLARTRPAPRYEEPGELPEVTLVITAYNEQATIAAKLENSLALDYPPAKLQIIVAADGSDDATPQIVASFAPRGVELSYSPPRRGKLAATLRAIERASGEIVVLSDANNMYNPGALKALVAPFADPQIGVTTGAKHIVKGDGVLGDSEGLYWKYESFIKQQETRLGCTTGVAGEILAVRRSLFEAPPADLAPLVADDLYTALRIVKKGYRIAYVPAAQSTERVSLSAHDEVERRARIVAMRLWMMRVSHRVLPFRRPVVVWQIVSHKYLRPLVPLAALGALAANLAAVARPARGSRTPVRDLAPPVGYGLLALQALFYGMAWLGNRVERRAQAGKLERLLYLPTFLVNSNAAAAKGLYRFATRRQGANWRRVERRGAEPAVTNAEPTDR